MKYELYTDGSCLKNPGDGGYAFIVICNNKILLKVCGCKENTTNNRMELYAIVRGIEHICKMDLFTDKNKVDNLVEREKEVIVYSDSAYCLNPINQKWIYMWKFKGWKTASNEEVKNSDLWKKILYFLGKENLKLSFVKVKGHSGNKYNEMVDAAAKKAAIKNLKE